MATYTIVETKYHTELQHLVLHHVDVNNVRTLINVPIYTARMYIARTLDRTVENIIIEEYSDGTTFEYLTVADFLKDIDT